MTCYAPGDDIVVYDIGTPREFDGQQAMRADFQNFFDSMKNAKVEFLSLHVATDGKMAMASSVQHFTGTDKSGKPVDMTSSDRRLAEANGPVEDNPHPRVISDRHVDWEGRHAIENVTYNGSVNRICSAECHLPDPSAQRPVWSQAGPRHPLAKSTARGL
jgi:hypothetical protein